MQKAPVSGGAGGAATTRPGGNQAGHAARRGCKSRTDWQRRAAAMRRSACAAARPAGPRDEPIRWPDPAPDRVEPDSFDQLGERPAVPLIPLVPEAAIYIYMYESSPRSLSHRWTT